MSTVIAVTNPKGGVGKSWVSATLTDYMHQRGYDTLCIDTDPQQTLTKFYGGSELLVNYVPISSVGTAIKAMRDKFDVVIIDTQGSKSGVLDSKFIEVIKHSDIVLIPLQPTLIDFDPAASIIEAINSRWSLLDEIKPKAMFVLNRCDEKTASAKNSRRLLNDLEGYVVADTSFKHWQSVATLMEQGKTLLEDKRLSHVAIAFGEEVEAMLDE